MEPINYHSPSCISFSLTAIITDVDYIQDFKTFISDK